ncbi:MAG: peptidylprolyl isomerase [Dehalococcoidia bacterium]|nr:peptidylprolyl isomerase [Dehalococcoidia bacterium]
MADTGPTATARSVTATAVGQDTGAVPTPKQLRFSQPPPLAIDQNKRYFATIDIAGKGKVRLELYPKKAPITVNSFVFLARQGFYDGVSFHRVIAGFVAQGGDPTGTGSGGPGYQFVNESSDLRHTRGALSMANSGPNTNGSQFYICLADQPGLDGSYTVFGQVVEGMDVVLSIKLRDPQQSPNAPAGDRMRSVTIQEQ